MKSLRYAPGKVFLGVGIEVVKADIKVLGHMAEESKGKVEFEYDYFPWGCEYYLEHGKMISDEGAENCVITMLLLKILHQLLIKHN